MTRSFSAFAASMAAGCSFRKGCRVRLRLEGREVQPLLELVVRAATSAGP